jgi:arginine utilization protein RocB
MSTEAKSKWYNTVEEITKRLVSIKSVSPSPEDENACAEEIHRILEELELSPSFWEIPGDGRKSVWTMVEGGSVPQDSEQIPTIILIGHFDTVGVGDYEDKNIAFDSDKLQELYSQQHGENRDIFQDARSGEWMFGRGSFDMKSGIAAQIAVTKALADQSDTLPGNVVLVATPDEEEGSAGIIDAVRQLIDLGNRYNLIYLGVINSDYTAPREPGDDNRYIYRGTIGKLLPCFYIRGVETHVGEAFRGLDANLIAAMLIQEVDLNINLCDEADGEITVPPVTLKQRDLKDSYNVQTPIASMVYFNFLTHSWTPRDVLVKMVALAERALSKANQKRVFQWTEYAQRQNSDVSLEDLGGKVWTFQQLFDAVANQPYYTESELRQELEDKFPEYLGNAKIDSRERSLAFVRALEEIAIRQGIIDRRKPVIVVYFSPPFYPHIPGNKEGKLSRAIESVVNTGLYGDIQFRAFYPYISDSSYVRIEQSVYASLPTLKKNMPLWRDQADSQIKKGEYYHIPLELIHELDCDIANIGPWGKEAHGKGERVFMPYSFNLVPELLYNVVINVLEGFYQ